MKEELNNIQKLFDSIDADKIDEVESLIKNSPDLINFTFSVNRFIETPLWRAIDCGKKSIALYLIENGADVNFNAGYQKSNGEFFHDSSIIKKAIIFGNFELVQAILQTSKVNLKFQDPNSGNTPLIYGIINFKIREV